MTSGSRSLIVATSNAGKLREIAELLADLPLAVVGMAQRWGGVAPRIPETGDTFEENACRKAQWVFERTGEWTLADDSGLEVDALDGAPGVRSARYAGAEATDAENNRRLLAQLRDVPAEERTARFRCVMALVDGRGAVLTVAGQCAGRIATAPAGSGGFGYDPLFVPDGYSRTFAELGAATKNTMSHRARALEDLRTEMAKLDGLGRTR
jgi:XTP/dITP diphosphohydrolase